MQSSAIWAVAISADDMKVAIGLENGALKVLDSWTGETLFEDTRAHTRTVYSVEFSPDGKRLVTGSWDNTIRLWNIENWAPIGSPAEEHLMEVTSFAFSRNGQQLLSGGGEGTVRLWDVAPAQSDCNLSNGPVLRQKIVFPTDQVKGLSFTPDEKRFISGSLGGIVRISERIVCPGRETQELCAQFICEWHFFESQWIATPICIDGQDNPYVEYSDVRATWNSTTSSRR